MAFDKQKQINYIYFSTSHEILSHAVEKMQNEISLTKC